MHINLLRYSVFCVGFLVLEYQRIVDATFLDSVTRLLSLDLGAEVFPEIVGGVPARLKEDDSTEGTISEAATWTGLFPNNILYKLLGVTPPPKSTEQENADKAKHKLRRAPFDDFKLGGTEIFRNVAKKVGTSVLDDIGLRDLFTVTDILGSPLNKIVALAGESEKTGDTVETDADQETVPLEKTSSDARDFKLLDIFSRGVETLAGATTKLTTPEVLSTLETALKQTSAFMKTGSDMFPLFKKELRQLSDDADVDPEVSMATDLRTMIFVTFLPAYFLLQDSPIPRILMSRYVGDQPAALGDVLLDIRDASWQTESLYHTLTAVEEVVAKASLSVVGQTVFELTPESHAKLLALADATSKEDMLLSKLKRQIDTLSGDLESLLYATSGGAMNPLAVGLVQTHVAVESLMETPGSVSSWYRLEAALENTHGILRRLQERWNFGEDLTLVVDATLTSVELLVDTLKERTKEQPLDVAFLMEIAQKLGDVGQQFAKLKNAELSEPKLKYAFADVTEHVQEVKEVHLPFRYPASFTFLSEGFDFSKEKVASFPAEAFHFDKTPMTLLGLQDTFLNFGPLFAATSSFPLLQEMLLALQDAFSLSVQTLDAEGGEGARFEGSAGALILVKLLSLEKAQEAARDVIADLETPNLSSIAELLLGEVPLVETASVTKVDTPSDELSTDDAESTLRGHQSTDTVPLSGTASPARALEGLTASPQFGIFILSWRLRSQALTFSVLSRLFRDLHSAAPSCDDTVASLQNLVRAQALVGNPVDLISEHLARSQEKTEQPKTDDIPPTPRPMSDDEVKALKLCEIRRDTVDALKALAGHFDKLATVGRSLAVTTDLEQGKKLMDEYSALLEPFKESST